MRPVLFTFIFQFKTLRTPEYPDDIKIKDALPLYFKKYHFSDGGYDDKYFKIKIGRLFIPVPNTKTRIKAVKFHDVHHLLTEYSAFWKGEVEIGAWEIASGCGNLWIAWFLNFGSFAVGVFLYPKALYNAFMMGRHVKSNLYHGSEYNEALLNRRIGELRNEFRVGQVKNNSGSDLLCFGAWVLLVLSGIVLAVYLFCLVFKI